MSYDYEAPTKQSNIVEFDSIQAINITQNSVTTIARTSLPVLCEVEYTKLRTSDSSFASDAVQNSNEPHLEHRVTINELSSSTVYNYRFQADNGGEKFYTAVRVFTTLSAK
jgi:phosphodiesterase/alkaline phosphatase D-like protein